MKVRSKAKSIYFQIKILNISTFYLLYLLCLKITFHMYLYLINTTILHIYLKVLKKKTLLFYIHL